MSKAADLAALIGSQSSLSNRNLIINGAMQVAQRGTSETGVTGVKYADAPDRFKAQITTAGTWTLSQSSTAPDAFSSSYKWDCTTADASLAAGDVVQLVSKIEAQDLQSLSYGTSSAQYITVSFWVRSAKTGTYIFEIFQEDSSRSISSSYTISTADTWEHKTISIVGDSSGVINNDNGTGFECIWWLAAGTNFTSGTLQTSWGAISSTARAVGQVNLADSTDNDWYITGIQLEVGEQATPFEHRSYGDELARCQRYYGVVYTSNRATVDSGELGGHFTFKTTMRASPTMGDFDAGSPENITGLDQFYGTNTEGSGVSITTGGSGNRYVFGASATADAEL